MTREEREEAIAYANRVIELGLNDETQAFCDMAFKALEQEPCNDCISREEALKGVDMLCLETSYDNEKVADMIRDLPPVQPKQKTGHWIESEYGKMITTHRYYCSECGGKHTDPNTGEWREVFDYKYPYCPLCGAKMNEGVEE